MSKSVLVIDTPEDCGDCMIRDLLDRCQHTEKSVEEYRDNKCKPDWCPLEDVPVNSIDQCILHLKRNGYIVKKFTKGMQADSNECVELEEKGKSKKCLTGVI